ncbi:MULTISPECIES: ankyrin repeat domain-containing protein [unclassified Streptomyces]|uniref:ankyrin repeat domain-containing protein n=1 Tax=unclassified Streptomyces TaxID=2593676 RepID=UPI002E120892|nr:MULTISPECIES: ankyrin repeat domain-containing protein [unclassified Streptomyces]WSR22613.1 ankyrin repeat domain-containing protein [Streptomyces sp. NBC_01205]
MSPRTELPGGFLAEDGPAWQRIRRHAVPGWMIERATGHRLAGDWRAACAAAAVDVRFDLIELAARHGAPVAEAVEEDLRHLAPDLVRWHLPRVLGGRTTIDTDLRVLLARYGAGDGAPVLSVTTGAMIEGPQRLRLDCAPIDPAERNRVRAGANQLRAEDWTAARPLWDARHTAALRERHTGGADRLPFFRPDGTPLLPDELPTADPGAADPAARAEWVALLHARGDHAAAHEAAGIERDLTLPEEVTRYGRGADPETLTASPALDLTRLGAEVQRLAAAGAGDRFRMAVHWRGNLLVEPAGPGSGERLRTRVVGWDELKDVPRLPLYAWKRLPDLELVRTGRIAPRELHPLVAEALFPEAGPAAGPPGPAGAAPVRVRCRGEWHELRSQGGVLDLLPHSREEQQRERAMRAFGGAIEGCFAVQQIWTTGEGRLPRALRAQRRELFLRAQHGDTPGVVALLDAGTDPRVRDARGYTLLHQLHLLDHEALLPRLLSAGLDLEAQAKSGHTPLQLAVQYGGSADLVRALVAAGSRIDVVDEADLSLAQVVRRYKRTDLAFLRSRVEEEFPDVGSEWFDEYMDERESDEESEQA